VPVFSGPNERPDSPAPTSASGLPSLGLPCPGLRSDAWLGGDDEVALR
jgi:hypothetical protein